MIDHLESVLVKVLDVALLNDALYVSRITPSKVGLFRTVSHDGRKMKRAVFVWNEGALFVWKEANHQAFPYGSRYVTPEQAMRIIKLNWNKRDNLSRQENDNGH